MEKVYLHPVNTPRLGRGRRRYLFQKNEETFDYRQDPQAAKVGTYFDNILTSERERLRLPRLDSHYQAPYPRSISRNRAYQRNISPLGHYPLNMDRAEKKDFPNDKDSLAYLKKPGDLLNLASHPAFRQPIYTRSNRKISPHDPITGLTRDSRYNASPSRLSNHGDDQVRARSISPI